jgi:type IV pilus assembly protein PilM
MPQLTLPQLQLSELIDPLRQLLGTSQHSVGVEFTGDRLNIADLSRQGGLYRLNTLLSEPLPEDLHNSGQSPDLDDMADFLKQTFATHRIRCRQVVAAIPTREAVSRLIAMPAELDEAELREMVLHQEAALHLPFPREEADIDYQKLSYFLDEDDIEKVQVFMVATRRSVTDSYLDLFTKAGLKIKVLEVTSFALLRTLREPLRQFGPQDAVVVVDLEFDATEIAIVVDGIPRFSRSIPLGTLQVEQAVARSLGLPSEQRHPALVLDTATSWNPGDAITPKLLPEQQALGRILGELADELQRSIDFYRTQDPSVEIQQIFLTGPGSGFPGLADFLTQQLAVPADCIDPIDGLGLKLPEHFDPSLRSHMGIVLGLGLRGASYVHA